MRLYCVYISTCIVWSCASDAVKFILSMNNLKKKIKKSLIMVPERDVVWVGWGEGRRARVKNSKKISNGATVI